MRRGVGDASVRHGEDDSVFLGTHVHGVDAKGRVSSPAEFRAVVAKDGLEGVYLWTAIEGGFLQGCGAELMGRYEERLRTSDPFADARNPAVDAVLARARLFKFDATGRITLPKALIEDAGLDGQATFVGRGDRFEMWSATAWAERSAREAQSERETRQLRDELAHMEREVELLERRRMLEERAARAKGSPGGESPHTDTGAGDVG